MFDDFDTQIQCEELAWQFEEYLRYRDEMEAEFDEEIG